MGRIRQFLGLEESATVTETESGALASAEYKLEKLQESLGSLELAMQDAGWERLVMDMAGEFSREGLKRSAQLCRLMAIANPLIKRGLAVRAAYVHGQGVGITARADGTEGTQDVNAVIQQFLDDDSNRANFTGAQAKVRLETALGTDGNVFITCFTDPLDGRVDARTLPFDEIVEKITAPGDRGTTHYYRRRWREGTTEYEELYPDLRYRPGMRAKTFTADLGGTATRINWDSPVYHLHDNGLDGWSFGIGDAYAALPWARAYKEFLEDWTMLIKALSKIAFTAVRDKKTPASQRARSGLRDLSNMPAGSSVEMSEGQKLEAVPKSGATIDSGSGRPVMSMVAAALGLPVTTLSADPGQTGARAVAETLNLPTRLEFQFRQSLWTEAYRAILGYVIDQAIQAPRGPLKGGTARRGDTLAMTLAGGDDRTLDIVWPDLNDLPIETIMKAIEAADGTGTIPKLLIARLTMRALGVDDVDEWLAKITDDNGDFIDPAVNAGQVAADNFRDGKIPIV
ncbi:hypothetical protein [Arthrobacter cryoconiti]|uniref:Portal protein n=1 Tax=Arthrobacter cryoconiti TaxID=748907 RepID=A0ABV8QWC8_9MICC|nr:hypothetical protein [Arthrobacter cryoconiti]MCC9068807.1 hypothetical protein [Arthrobacter cryoconiti]